MLKGKCIEYDKKGFSLFSFENMKPIKDRVYQLKDITDGTLQQNNTFHDLYTILYDFMLKTDCFMVEDDEIVYDLRCSDPNNLKDLLKAKYGKPYAKIYYADIINNKPVLLQADNFNQLPMHVKEDFRDGNKQRLLGKLDSWSDYTIKERKTLISRLLYIMDRFGVDTQKYLDIRKNFDDNEVKYINRVANKFNGRIES